jgi:hypothetical protein
MAPENAVHDFRFPNSHHLVVVTRRRVLAWDATEVRPIFDSGSAGILAAKESGNGSGTLAIADSQIVLLHKVEKTRERSYRLKGADVGLAVQAEEQSNTNRAKYACSNSRLNATPSSSAPLSSRPSKPTASRAPASSTQAPPTRRRRLPSQSRPSPIC